MAVFARTKFIVFFRRNSAVGAAEHAELFCQVLYSAPALMK